jgi:N-acetylmuramoyl-L-alanine amidase
MLVGFKSPTNEYEYLAKCVQAEAGNQSEYGKRLVCDVVLNRYDAGGYGSIQDVINEKNQFSCVRGKTIKATPTPEIYAIIEEEMQSRTNDRVWYFRTNKYHSYGSPLFKVGDHYFSER